MSLKSGDYPWCVCESTGNSVMFACKRCNQKHIFDNVGMSIDKFCKKAEAFCHDDYDKPLDVHIYCSFHHGETWRKY